MPGDAPAPAPAPAPRSSVRWRLLLAFFGVSSFAVIGGAVAIFAFFKIEDVLERITDHSVPSALASLQLSREAERLVSAAPVLLTSTSQDEHQERASEIRDELARLGDILENLKQYHFDALVIEQIVSAVDWLTLNLISMETTVGNALAIGEQRKALTQNALEEASAMQLALEPEIDRFNNEIAGTADIANAPVMGTRTQADAPTRSGENVATLGPLMRLRFELMALADRLTSIGSIDDREILVAANKQFASSLDRLRVLADRLDSTLNADIIGHTSRFGTYVSGAKSVLRIRLLELDARQNARRLLTESTKASQQLSRTIEHLVSDTEEGISKAGAEARQERRTGTVLLIVVVILSLASSLLIVWLYVERSLIRRLTSLSKSMLSIARGNLQTAIPAGGTDEIASMADALTIFRAATAERAAAERARANLSRYFSPNLADHLAENPDTFELGGERRNLTFLFTDLAGFTPLVEKLDPAVVVSVMNEYIGGVSAIVFDHGGTVDTVVGDAVHAIFGAPLEQPDHAARAVDCALAIDSFTRTFAEDRASENIPVGITRVGVHTGSAIVGNFGGENYFHYTAHGDAVNTAARLETANKALGTRMCVSADTVALIPDFVGRPVGDLILKCKEKEISAFEPVDRNEAGSERLEAYLAAFKKIQAGDPECLRAFASYVGDYGNEPLANFHLQRLLAGRISTIIVLDET
jgi:class 3 adenylate cyclase